MQSNSCSNPKPDPTASLLRAMFRLSRCAWRRFAPAPDHVNACEYARIGLSVWRAKPAVLHEYENWFFEPERPRPVAETRAKAAALTGRPDLAMVEDDPWINDWLKLGRDLFKANWDKSGRNFLPMLMAGPMLVSGEIKTDAELFDLLEKYMGLKRPSAPPVSVTQ